MENMSLDLNESLDFIFHNIKYLSWVLKNFQHDNKFPKEISALFFKLDRAFYFGGDAEKIK